MLVLASELLENQYCVLCPRYGNGNTVRWFEPMELHSYSHINRPQCSNIHKYCVVTMNKIAVGIEYENSMQYICHFTLKEGLLILTRH